MVATAVRAEKNFALAVDIGGTFTDVVLRRADGAIFVDKVLTTHHGLLEAFFQGVDAVLRKAGVGPEAVDDLVVHATTVVTNASGVYTAIVPIGTTTINVSEADAQMPAGATLTTANDPQGRKTVMDLVKNATPERVCPVGRLDRNTTGVLILTNDGELAQKLTHPSFEIKKIYEVTLDKPVTKKDLDAILEGVTLEDGFVKADAAGYADPKNKAVVGIEIHSGRNRIVRRIFEHLGYKVKNLDRVMFANLTKKNVDRGKWRYLNEKEIRLLKYMNQSFVRSKKA